MLDEIINYVQSLQRQVEVNLELALSPIPPFYFTIEFLLFILSLKVLELLY